MQIDLTNKNILVTGGGGDGLGQGICEAIAACGGNLIVNDLNAELAKETAAKHEGAVAIPGDVSVEEEVGHIFEEAKAKVGVLDGLVNNAGIGLPRYAYEAHKSEVDHLYDVDVKGLWMMSRGFVRQLLQEKVSGHIVNIASVQALATMPKMALYAGAKSAVTGLTRGMAVELGKHNIRCNAVAPGLIYSEQTLNIIGKWSSDPVQWMDDHKTDHQCLDFFTSARDCGNVIAFLLSELSRSITGQTIVVDNGTTNLLYNLKYTSGDTEGEHF
jgi:NAD(P)-dependent dehydrogenase (short-subunit alcohol dehydrogenase family)